VLFLLFLPAFGFVAGAWLRGPVAAAVPLTAPGPAALAAAQPPDGETILRRVDDNIGSDNKITVSEMIIHGRRGSRSIRAKSWVSGRTKSFTEYLDPPREKGTKMLKLEDQLWTYAPASDRTILIAGHMLRQPIMGSDLSYEDMLEDPRLSVLYAAAVGGEEERGGRDCWVLDLVSRGGEIAYFKRRIWVDKERFIVLREERFAKSGKLLKTTDVKGVERQGGRWVPTRIVFKDALKEGQGTEFVLESIEFNAVIPDHVFTKASLR
jgi:outer membrane lipoprotein-sorting protein